MVTVDTPKKLKKRPIERRGIAIKGDKWIFKGCSYGSGHFTITDKLGKSDLQMLRVKYTEFKLLKQRKQRGYDVDIYFEQ